MMKLALFLLTSLIWAASEAQTISTGASETIASCATTAVQATVAINAGGDTIEPFVADTYFGGLQGGSTGVVQTTSSSIDTSGVTNPAPAGIYQSERWGEPDEFVGSGTFAYNIAGLDASANPNLIPGESYQVRLHFAEIVWDQPAQRQFNVAIQGSRVLTDFDIVAEAGGANKAIVKEFNTIASDFGGIGIINISFSPGAAYYPQVSAIEVLPAARPTEQQTVFTDQRPEAAGSEGVYELGMKFRAEVAGELVAIRFWKHEKETGTHIGNIWSADGTRLASVTFCNETVSGWQQQALDPPLAITANTTYVVSVNNGDNNYYVATVRGLETEIVNGDLGSQADGDNGVFIASPGSFPTRSWNNTNYFRDVVFVPTQ